MTSHGVACAIAEIVVLRDIMPPPPKKKTVFRKDGVALVQSGEAGRKITAIKRA